MAQKIYYDAVNNKQVVDVSGVKDEAQVKAEFALDDSVQTLVIDETAGDTHYVDNGTLKKKTGADNQAEQAAAQAAKEAAKEAKKASAQAALKLTDAEWAIVQEALS
jgi:hypothetical protein